MKIIFATLSMMLSISWNLHFMLRNLLHELLMVWNFFFACCIPFTTIFLLLLFRTKNYPVSQPERRQSNFKAIQCMQISYEPMQTSLIPEAIEYNFSSTAVETSATAAVWSTLLERVRKKNRLLLPLTAPVILLCRCVV